MHQCFGAEKHALARLKLDDIPEEFGESLLLVVVIIIPISTFLLAQWGAISRNTGDVSLDVLEPVRACEPVDDGGGTQLQKPRGECGFLGCDDDASSQVALEADYVEEFFRER